MSAAPSEPVATQDVDLTVGSLTPRRSRTWPLVVAGVGLVVWAVINAIGGFESGYWSIILPVTLVVGAVIMARAVGHPVGTLLFVSGLLMLAGTVAELFEGPWADSVGQAVSTFAVPFLFLVLLRFPTGALIGPSWRWAERFWLLVCTIGATAALINKAWGGDRGQLVGGEGPLREQWGWLGDGLSSAFFPGFTMLGVLGLASVVFRYRTGTARDRVKIRWLLFAAGVLALALAAQGTVFSQSSSSTHWSAAVMASATAFIPVSIGIAIVRHQLFDIDVVISRTLVYASMLALIGGIYVAVVFGVGSLFDRSDEGSPVLPVVATALVAIVFHPTRVRLERLANRIVFGRRASPYEVLSEFTQRVAATDEQLLADVARSVVDGTVATEASVWVLDDGMLEPVSIWPDGDATTQTTALAGASDELIVPGADETYPIRHDDKVIGALGLAFPAMDSLPPSDRALIDELTAGIGLALWNRALTGELQATVDDLRASRRRLVSVQDATRHRLERDLHDGAQQRLVAIKVRLSIVRQMMEKAEATDQARELAELCDDADEAIESLRDVARGIYPPLLEAEGLRAALIAQIGRSPLPIELSSEIQDRHGRDVEATTYFTILEALAAVERLSPTELVKVSVREQADRLVFEVIGPAEAVPPHHVEDRIDALGGEVRFGDDVAVVTGSLPISPEREVVIA